jgi:ribonuclease HI
MNKPTSGISVDGGTKGNPGECFYRAVDIATGQELFREELGMGTNNIAEFLAICHAIHYCSKKKITPPIYSDSITALSWVRKRQTNSSFDGPVNERMVSAVKYLKKTKHPYQLLKWKTKEWGEIPADFGRK